MKDKLRQPGMDWWNKSSNNVIRLSFIFILLAFLPAIAWAASLTNAAPPKYETFLHRADIRLLMLQLQPQFSSLGIKQRDIAPIISKIDIKPSIAARTEYQGEFTHSIDDYLSRAVQSEKIKYGQALRRRHRQLLDRIESVYRVDQNIILAVWGMETNFGRYTGNYNPLEALLSLAMLDNKRTNYWQAELVNAIQIVWQGHIKLEDMVGSWAGAMGHVQFMPSNFHRYAVDFDGDGRKDIWNNIPDALASAANFLADKGWNFRKSWGYEVHLPGKLNSSLLDEENLWSLSKWRKFGVKRTANRQFPRAGDAARLLLPVGWRGPGFLIIDNFHVLRRYNNSQSYVLALGQLADRIGREPGLQIAWPKDIKPLSRGEWRELQQLLSELGYDVGKIDGRGGRKTRHGIRKFQVANQLVADGHADQEFLARLRRHFQDHIRQAAYHEHALVKAAHSTN